MQRSIVGGSGRLLLASTPPGMEKGGLAAAWNNALLPKNVESKVQKTLSYAPRDLRCTWRDCSFVDDPFDSLQALIQHTKKKHAAPPAASLGLKKTPIRCLFTSGCKYVSQNNDDLFKHIERAHWEPIRSRCYVCTFRDSSPLGMVSHLEKKHGIKPVAHPITFFGKPPPLPANSWPTFEKPIETCFALLAPVNGSPFEESATLKAPSASSETSASTATSGSLIGAGWYSYLNGNIDPATTASPSSSKNGGAAEGDNDRYEFLDEDMRDADLMTFNAPPIRGKQPAPEDTNILLATDAKPIPFPTEPPPDEPATSGGGGNGGGNGGGDTTMGTRSRGESSSIGEIGGPTTETYGPFYAQLRTPPKGRVELSTGYPYKTGEPIVPKPPPPVRGNFLEQRKELLALFGKDKKDASMDLSRG